MFLGGPVLQYEMVTAGRRLRMILLRSVFLVLLFSGLWITYELTRVNQIDNELSTYAYARIGGYVFSLFAFGQLAAVLLIGPALATGAISEERERKTLDYILASDLTNWEIVSSKLVARFLHTAYLLLAGLPFLQLLTLIGGISPESVIQVYLLCASTLVMVVCISLALSAGANRTRSAVISVYLLLSFWLVMLPLAIWILPGSLSLWIWMTQQLEAFVYRMGIQWDFVLTGIDYLKEINPVSAGNPILATIDIIWPSPGAAASAWPSLCVCTAWQLLVSAGCVAYSVVGLRKLNRRIADQGPSAVPLRWRLPRVPVWDRSLLWKEFYAERSSTKAGALGRVVGVLITLLVLGIGFFILTVSGASWVNLSIYNFLVATFVSTAILLVTLLTNLRSGIAQRQDDARSQQGTHARVAHRLGDLVRDGVHRLIAHRTAFALIVASWIVLIAFSSSMAMALTIACVIGLQVTVLFVVLTIWELMPGSDLLRIAGILACLVLAVFVFCFGSFIFPSGIYGGNTEAIVIPIGMLTTLLGCGLIVFAGARAAMMISGEKERDTWITLLSSGFDGEQIAFSKVAGNVFQNRHFLLLQFVLWLPAIVIAPNAILVPIVQTATLSLLMVYASALGVLCSLKCGTTMRAMAATLSILFVSCGGYFFCCIPVLAAARGGDESMVVLFSLVVPFHLLLPSIVSAEGWPGPDQSVFLMFAYMVGHAYYFIASLALIGYLRSVFDALAGRAVPTAVQRMSPPIMAVVQPEPAIVGVPVVLPGPQETGPSS